MAVKNRQILDEPMLVEVLRLPWKSVLTKPWNKFHGFQRALKIILICFGTFLKELTRNQS
ncbi:hypothetical protein COU54_02020 [Candidatus Pacearchaeota archaeon CG10_big_fil_rev_8_21_14_0_10_31_24]|nr:MAG: hypothetical protein COU54_02020 [Candidatus Pacearchaeota archaeon CG10_big_fil_rev_8_21_14_0_10_31_24]